MADRHGERARALVTDLAKCVEVYHHGAWRRLPAESIGDESLGVAREHLEAFAREVEREAVETCARLAEWAEAAGSRPSDAIRSLLTQDTDTTASVHVCRLHDDEGNLSAQVLRDIAGDTDTTEGTGQP